MRTLVRRKAENAIHSFFGGVMAVKSTITCDMEGVIDTFNAGAEEIFGYSKEEVVGKKRVSLFSPGLVVLQNVEGWLASAVRDGEFVTDTEFVRKDGSTFPARVRISPTFRDGKQIGFCGVTELLQQPVQVPIQLSTRIISWLVITRAPFLSASLLPAFLGMFYGFGVGSSGASGLQIALAILGVALLHLAANVFNDYFDVKSGTDEANSGYFLKYSGGSRAIELRLITLQGTFRLASILLLIATAIGVYLSMSIGNGILLFGALGALSGFFYTAPPLRLVARRGMGELFIGLTFGPLITAGMCYVVSGVITPMAYLIGIPVGLLTANILLINQVPDADSDATTGKNHLVVTFGKQATPTIYAAIMLGAALMSGALAFMTQKMLLLVPAVVAAGFGLMIVNHMRQNILSRSLVKSNVNTIILQAIVGILSIVAIAI